MSLFNRKPIWKGKVVLQALMLFALAALLAVTGGVVSAKEDAELQRAIEALRMASKARAAIVRAVAPTVVHISVEKAVTSRPEGRHRERGRRGAPDFFEDDFFRRFFGPRLPDSRRFQRRGLGSGSIVDSRGYILTNNHVIKDADRIIVKLKNGEEYLAELIGTDPPSDLAVLKIDAKNLPVAKLGNSDLIEVGETVIAIGNPFGLEQTVTQGIVSAKKRSQVGLTDYEDFIQTDASINPGNSGGPLINLYGEIIGINTAIFSRSGGSMGIGFSIPINMARQIMNSLIEHGKFVRGFLGVVIQDINKELAEALGVRPKEGVLIANVGPETPAGKSGIRQQDIILTFNGKTVKSTTALRNAVAGVRPGVKVPVELLRSGKKMRLVVTIGEQPKNMQAAIQGSRNRQGGSGPRRGRPERILGIELEPLTKRLREQLGYQNRQGVVVSQVQPGGPAAEKGFRSDMLIERINSKVVRTVREFRTEISKVKKGESILMLVRFQNSSRFIVIKKP